MKIPIKLLTAALVSAATSANAIVILSENFDGGGVNSTFSYTTSGPPGTEPGTNGPGSASANSARITNLNASNNNSIAFDAVAIPTAQVLRFAFDFRLTDEAANTAAGGCCGQAADGLGLGFFPTAVYGTSGGINPSVGVAPFGVFNWERPGPGGTLVGSSSLILGLDIFDNDDVGPETGNEVNVAWDGAEIANAVPTFTLNDNVWHRAIVSITDLGTDAQVTVDLIQDVNGVATLNDNFLDATATGLGGFSASAIGTDFRLIGGGRTGGAFHEGRFDNILFEAVPEPGSLAFLGLGLAFAVTRRRRR